MKTEEQKKRKIILVFCCLISFGVLGIFKYYNFFVTSFINAFEIAGIQLHIKTLQLILPVGISFYTFHTLSYTIDVYRRKFEPTKNILSFFLFVSIFPLAMAGPIERATNLLPQINKPKTFDYASAVDGMRQILWGLFKKIAIADTAAIYVNQVFDTYQTQSGSTLLLGAVFFAFQIYGDFSGYSDMAIGIGKLLGYNFLRNFFYPYFSRDIAEFWRRWHISLTTWFRDYLYIPLGGSRVSKGRIVRNTFIIFLVSGFWHGANWTFIAWGAYHAILFLPLILLNKNRRYTDSIAPDKKFPNIRELLQMTMTFLLVVIGWIFFRADTIFQALLYIKRIFSPSFFTFPHYTLSLSFIFCLLILFLIEWFQRNKSHGLQLDNIKSKTMRIAVYYIIIIFISFFSQSGEQQFIYFQF
jgi:D-alanyl-lipoteichoic acid acyltransferase DltB (MBOAT superfamily)